MDSLRRHSWRPPIRREDAMLFKRLATLVPEPHVIAAVAELRWTGPRAALPAMCERLAAPDLLRRADALAGQRHA